MNSPNRRARSAGSSRRERAVPDVTADEAPPRVSPLSLAWRLRAARHLSGKAPAAVAAEAGISTAKYLALERGDQRRSTDLIRIANALDVNPLWLDTGRGAKQRARDVGPELTADEVEFLRLVREASPELREAVVALLYATEQ